MGAVPSTPPRTLRVAKDDRIGTTAFFRNRAFLNTLVNALHDTAVAPRVFVHACSIGAEPYSLAATAQMAGQDIAIDTTDLEPDFVAMARAGEYPAVTLDAMTDAERACFTVEAGGIRINDAVRACVRFVPPQSIETPLTETYDAVMAMNVLTYLPPERQRAAIATLAQSATRYLCLTAFHPDTIADDLKAAGFAPVMDNHQAIHEGWTDRLRPADQIIPGTREYSWKLPPYSTAPADYAWRYGAIFKRAV